MSPRKQPPTAHLQYLDLYQSQQAYIEQHSEMCIRDRAKESFVSCPPDTGSSSQEVRANRATPISRDSKVVRDIKILY